MAASVTGGDRHGSTRLRPLLGAIPPVRGRRGRRPRKLFATEAMTTTSTARQWDHPRNRPLWLRPGVGRWVVERDFAWLHAFERLCIRCGRRADLHLGLSQPACALIRYRTSRPV